MIQHKQLAENISAVPPVAVAGMTLFGYPISDWVQILAGLWLVLQIGWWVYTRIMKVHNEQSRNDGGTEPPAQGGR